MSKILIIAMNYAPEITGCGRYTGDLGAEMASRGHEVEIITSVPHYPGWRVRTPYSNRYIQEKSEETTIYRCPVLLHSPMSGIWRFLAPVSFAITSAPLIFWRLLFRKTDTVLLVEPTLFAAPLTLLFAKIVRARTVLHVQDLEVDAAFSVGHLVSKRGLVKKLGFLFERLCLRHFDQIITISRKMADKIASKGVLSARIAVIRNWVDLDHFNAAEKSSSYREKLGLPRDAFVVLYSGNIGPKQGLDVVIEAARLLRKTPSILFVIAGEGPCRDDLQKQSSDLENVVYLPFQPYEQLGQFLGLCDLHILPQMAGIADLVLPSKLGGMLASGRPMVVTAEPQTELAECLKDIATLVPPGDAITLAEAISEITHSAPSEENSSAGLALARELARPAAMDRLEYILLNRFDVNDLYKPKTA